MKQVWVFALALMTAAVLSSGRAEAQVEAHDLRLFLDGSVMRWMKTEETYKVPGFTDKEKFEVTGSGAFVGAGVGAGFAVNRYLIPQLYFSLQNAKATEQGYATVVRQWELKPSLELAVLPQLRLVPFVDLGLSLQRQLIGSRNDDGDAKQSLFGVGPALTVGAHLFVIPHGSLDLSLGYRALFFGKTSGTEAAEDRPNKTIQHVLALNLGASFWI